MRRRLKRRQGRDANSLSYKFRVARTSLAGVLSPVQLISRGAVRILTTYPKSWYNSRIRSVA